MTTDKVMRIVISNGGGVPFFNMVWPVTFNSVERYKDSVDL